MINQIAPILPSIAKFNGIDNRTVQAGRIEAKLEDRTGDDFKPESGILWNPDFAAPYLVPIIRWIE